MLSRHRPSSQHRHTACRACLACYVLCIQHRCLAGLTGSEAPAIATSTSAVPRASCVDSRTPSSIDRNRFLRVHSPRSAKLRAGDVHSVRPHIGLCPIVPRSSSGTLAPRLVSIATPCSLTSPSRRPTNLRSAAPISPLETPFKYSHGSAPSSLFVFLTYAGTSAERNVTASARTFGIFTVPARAPADSHYERSQIAQALHRQLLRSRTIPSRNQQRYKKCAGDVPGGARRSSRQRRGRPLRWGAADARHCEGADDQSQAARSR